MELKVEEIKVPDVIKFNFEELKAELMVKCADFEAMVYTDDQIKLAKNDRANLNRLKKALNEERIRMEKEYLRPFEEFKAKINEIITIIDKPVAIIDKQVKAYEEEQKVKKTEQIESIFEAIEGKPDWLILKAIWNERWLNATFALSAIQSEIKERILQILEDVSTLSDLPEFGFEATEVYKTTLDVNKALNEGARLAEIQKKKAESIAKEQEPIIFQSIINEPEEDVKEWVNFSAFLSMADAIKLSAFCRENNIKIKKI